MAIYVCIIATSKVSMFDIFSYVIVTYKNNMKKKYLKILQKKENVYPKHYVQTGDIYFIYHISTFDLRSAKKICV